MPESKTEKEQKKDTVMINDKEYSQDDLSEKQIMLVNHVADLDRKIQGSAFNLDQLNGGRNFFMTELEESLNGKEPEPEAE